MRIVHPTACSGTVRTFPRLGVPHRRSFINHPCAFFEIHVLFPINFRMNPAKDTDDPVHVLAFLSSTLPHFSHSRRWRSKVPVEYFSASSNFRPVSTSYCMYVIPVASVIHFDHLCQHSISFPFPRCAPAQLNPFPFRHASTAQWSFRCAESCRTFPIAASCSRAKPASVLLSLRVARRWAGLRRALVDCPLAMQFNILLRRLACATP